MTEKKTQLGCLGWIIQELLDTVISIILFILSYLLFIVLLGFGFDNTESIRFLSVTGLVVIVGGLYLFLWALRTQKNLLKKEYEASIYRDKEKGWFFRNIFSFQVLLFGYFERKLYTIAGLVLSFTSIFISILLEIGSGDFAGYFDKQNWKTEYVIFAIIPFFVGIVADWIKRNDHKLLEQNIAARLLTFLGILEFYPGLLLFITGLAGGRDSFFPASRLNDILSLEIFLFNWIPKSYEVSASYELMSSLGLKWFVTLYFAIPLLVYINTRRILKKHEFDSYYLSDTPIEIIKDSNRLSFLILLIPLYVGWNEGWIQNIFGYLISKLSELL